MLCHDREDCHIMAVRSRCKVMSVLMDEDMKAVEVRLVL